MMRAAEIVCALVLLGAGGLVLWETLRTLNVGWDPAGPGAGFFPFWLAVGLVVSAAAVLVQGVRRGPIPRPSRRFVPEGAMPALLKVVLPIAGMIVAIEIVGFYVAAALYVGLAMRWMGRHGWPLVIGLSLLIPVATYLVIERYFLILLPKGYFGGYLPF